MDAELSLICSSGGGAESWDAGLWLVELIDLNKSFLGKNSFFSGQNIQKNV
jgi:hypothetical protein